MVTVCILWFGGQTDVGVHVTVPSCWFVVVLMHGTEPGLCAPWPADAGRETASAAAAAAPRARRLLTCTDPPEDKAVPRGWQRWGFRPVFYGVLAGPPEQIRTSDARRRIAVTSPPLCSTCCTQNRT